MDGCSAERTRKAVPPPTPMPGALRPAPGAEAKASPSSPATRTSTGPSALRSQTPTATPPRTPDRSTAATPCSETTRRRSSCRTDAAGLVLFARDVPKLLREPDLRGPQLEARKAPAHRAPRRMPDGASWGQSPDPE